MEEALFIDYYQSPIGILKIVCSSVGLQILSFREKEDEPASDNELTQKVQLQLQEYFEGSRTTFEVPLAPQGTLFQQKVWLSLQNIDFGNTTTYQKQAIDLGDVKAIRAMASANGKNPIAIIIPCHRVIGTNGSLTGYAGELWRKQWLLEHEATLSGKRNTLF